MSVLNLASIPETTRLVEPLKLDVTDWQITDAQFYDFCRRNPDLNFEMTARGEILIMPPVGGESGRRESKLNLKVGVWNERTNLGEVFSSSTVFRLPNGAKRSPDVAWIERSRWEALTVEEQEKFPLIAPDFVIELRSKTDALPPLQEKLREYIDNGVRLGWLINPQDQQVEIYRADQAVATIDLPAQLSGEDVMPGFVLDLPLF